MTTKQLSRRPAVEMAALIERTRLQAEMIRVEVARSHRLVSESLALLRAFPVSKPRGE